MSSEPQAEKRQRGHQADLLSVRWISLLGIGLLIMVVVVQAGLALAMRLLIPQQPLVHVNQQSREQRIGPGVQPNQAYDRATYDKQLDSRLHSYGWQDPDQQIARIPIDRAMELMSQRQLKTDWPSTDRDDTSEQPEKEKPSPEDSTKGEKP